MTLPDRDAFSTFASTTNLRNYARITNPETDIDAEAFKKTFANIAMMTRMALRGYVVFQFDGDACSVVEHDALWGNDSGVIPSVERDTDGIYIITWPESVNDPLGTSHDINIKRLLEPQIDGTSTLYHGRARRLTANTAEVRIFDVNGTLLDVTDTDIEVFFL